MRVSMMSYLAEFFGTFFFILSIFVSGGNPLVIGAALALVIFLIAHVSGGMVNPAVSLAMFMDGKLNGMELFAYAFSQLLGGASAYYAHKML
jgi:aquaporin Z